MTSIGTNVLPNSVNHYQMNAYPPASSATAQRNVGLAGYPSSQMNHVGYQHHHHHQQQQPQPPVPHHHQQAPPQQQQQQKPAKQPSNQRAVNIVVKDIVEDVTTRATSGILKRYRRGVALGRGGFAKCYLLTSLDTQREYAGKFISKQSMINPTAKSKIHTEIRIHRSIQHKHIVKFERYFEDGDNLVMLLELCREKTLMELSKARTTLTETETQYFLWQIIEVVHALHSNNIIHRDLKLGNIFLDHNMNIKIGDFGLATRLDDANERKKTICGTPNYIAPEIICDKTGTGHSFQVDIWAIGVIAYTMLFGKPPFETQSVKETYQKIRDTAYTFPENTDVSDAAKAFIASMLKYSPDERATLQELRTHEFFTCSPFPKALPTSIRTTPFPFEHRFKSAKYNRPPQEVNFAPQAVIPLPVIEPRKPTSSVDRTRTATATGAAAATAVGSSSRATTSSSAMNMHHTTATYASSSNNNNENRPSSSQQQTMMHPGASTLVTKHMPSTASTGSVASAGSASSVAVANNPRALNVISGAVTNTLRNTASSSTNTMSSNTIKPHASTASSTTTTTTTTGKPYSTTPPPASSTVNTSDNTKIDQLNRQLQKMSLGSTTTSTTTPTTTTTTTPTTTTTKSSSSTAAPASTTSTPSPTSAGYEQCSNVWVNLWVDYSHKYGVGYLLSNGSCGVYFNDFTKMILHANCKDIQYIEKIYNEATDTHETKITHFQYEEAPPTLEKKTALLHHFFHYLVANNKGGAPYPGQGDYTGITSHFNPQTATTVPLEHVRWWMKTEYATAFRLSSRAVQVIFDDVTEVLINHDAKLIVYTDKNRERTVYGFDQIQHLQKPEILKRVRYSMKIIQSNNSFQFQ